MTACRIAGAIAATMVFAACGGNVAESNANDAGLESGATFDGGVQPDAVVDTPFDAHDGDEAVLDAPSDAWHSYTVTVHDVTVKWDVTSPGTSPPSEGLVARFDWLQTAAASSAVVIGAYADPVLVTGPPGSPTTVDTKLDKGALTVGGGGGGTYAADTYRSFTVVLGADGKPSSGEVDGRAYAQIEDVAYNGTLHAKLSFAPDRDPPVWRGTADTTYADQPLPWDRRHLRTSEPYEGRIDPASVVLPAGASIFVHLLSSNVWGTTREYGFSFLALDWDVAPSLVVTSADFADLEGNHLDGFPIEFPVGGATVPHNDGATLRLPVGSIYKWGTANETEVCPTGGGAGVCVVLGPFDTNVCRDGSHAGFATRLGAFGDAYVNVRALAKPGLGTTGAPPDPTTLLYVHAQPPGSDAPSIGDLSSLKWPASPATDGSFDTGWTTIRASAFAPPGALATETGLSLGADGVHPPTGLPCGPPTPSWSVTIDVGAIAIGAPP